MGNYKNFFNNERKRKHDLKEIFDAIFYLLKIRMSVANVTNELRTLEYCLLLLQAMEK